LPVSPSKLDAAFGFYELHKCHTHGTAQSPARFGRGWHHATGLSRVHPKFHTPHIDLTISTLVALALILTKTLDCILAVTLQSIFILYIIHGVALIALRFVNKKLYDSALFRPKRLLIVVCGLFSVCCMIAFSYKMLIQTWQLILICAAVGTGIFLYRKVRDFKSEVLSEAEKL